MKWLVWLWDILSGGIGKLIGTAPTDQAKAVDNAERLGKSEANEAVDKGVLHDVAVAKQADDSVDADVARDPSGLRDDDGFEAK